MDFFLKMRFLQKIVEEKYVNNMVKLSNPSIGYKIIKFLIENNIVWHILTTNFDNLVEKVYPDIMVISESNIKSCFDKVKINSDNPQIIKLHGDFRYDWLKNTNDETKELNELIFKSLDNLIKYQGIVFLGYSGRDGIGNNIFRLLFKVKY